MRDEPGGTVVGSFFDGIVVQVLPGTIDQDGRVWVRVIASDGSNGWVVQELLSPATPTP
jgi:SH3-like domain-containing protein